MIHILLLVHRNMFDDTCWSQHCIILTFRISVLRLSDIPDVPDSIRAPESSDVYRTGSFQIITRIEGFRNTKCDFCGGTPASFDEVNLTAQRHIRKRLVDFHIAGFRVRICKFCWYRSTELPKSHHLWFYTYFSKKNWDSVFHMPWKTKDQILWVELSTWFRECEVELRHPFFNYNFN
jgi:hypothetical protein